jgi:hypothetical protein
MIPRWIITQKTMPHGVRGPKKPVLVIERESWPASRILTAGSGRDVYQPFEIPGLFKLWEWRFWACILTAPGHILAECRSCGHNSTESTSDRQLHFAKGGCTKRLCAAYDLLLKDSKCVICDHHTAQRKWGVPLCSSACTQAWCESEPQPRALLEALNLVGTEGWA